MDKVKLKWRHEMARAVAKGMIGSNYPIERIKKCTVCGEQFLQVTTLKQTCSRKCAVKLYDAKRKGTCKRIKSGERSSANQYAKRLLEKHGVEYAPIEDAGRIKNRWVPVAKGVVPPGQNRDKTGTKNG